MDDSLRKKQPPPAPVRRFTSIGRPLAVLVLIVFIVITLWGWHQVREQTWREAHANFEFRVAEVLSAIQQRMLAYEQVLRGGVAFMYASDEVTREDWRTYIRGLTLPTNYPGIQGIGFSRYLRDEQDREALERQVRRDGFPSFRVWPEGQREVYTSIVYLEPFDWRNQRAFGYDMFSEPTRRAAMIEARDTGEPALTSKLMLVQETSDNPQAGFLMYLPVYRGGIVPATLEERREAIAGFVYSPFRMEDLMRGILGRAVPDVGLRIYDGGMIDQANLMYDGGFAGEEHTFQSANVIDINGHQWTVVMTSRLVLEQEILQDDQPTAVLVGGLLLSVLLFALLWSIAGTEVRATAIARVMTDAFRRSEAKFTSLVQAAEDAIIITDAAGHIVSWNRGATTMFGYREDAVLGRQWTMILPERFRRDYDRRRAALVSGDDRLLNRVLQLSGIRENGAEFPVEMSLTQWGVEGETYLSAIIRDTTERRRVEEALRLSEQRFRVALQAADITVFSQDPDLRYTWVYNPMFGLTEETVVGRTDQEILPRQPGFAALKRRVFSTGERVHEKYDFAGEIGEERIADLVLEPVRERGVVTGLIGAAIDITALSRAERELKASEARFRTTFENAAIGIELSDLDGRILETNPALQQMLGYTADELRRADQRDLVHPDDAMISERLVEELDSGHHPYVKQQKRYLRKDGSIMWGSLTASLIRDDTGAPKLLLRMIEDITELRIAEQALKRAYHELEQRIEARTRELREQADELARSNAELEQFAYVASHDLQEPLRSVSGFAQLLERRYKDRLDDEGETFVRFIVSGTDRMRGLITDLLAFSRVGAREKVFKQVDTGAVVGQVRDSLSATIEERGAEVVIGPLPKVWGDAADLSQLFQNLIANGLKFNRSAPPRVEVQAEDAGDHWLFSVRDNGIGIEPSFFPRMFTIFQRGHRQDEYAGTGVGLAICKKVVERHSGRIWASSEPGQGTTFLFTLPKPPKESAPA